MERNRDVREVEREAQREEATASATTNEGARVHVRVRFQGDDEAGSEVPSLESTTSSMREQEARLMELLARWQEATEEERADPVAGLVRSLERIRAYEPEVRPEVRPEPRPEVRPEPQAEQRPARGPGLTMGNREAPVTVEERIGRQMEAVSRREREMAVGHIPGTNRYDRAIVMELEDVVGFDVLFHGILRRPGETYEEASERMDARSLSEHRRAIEQRIRTKVAEVKLMTKQEAEEKVLGQAIVERIEQEAALELILEPAQGWGPAPTRMNDDEGGSDDEDDDEDDEGTVTQEDVEGPGGPVLDPEVDENNNENEETE